MTLSKYLILLFFLFVIQYSLSRGAVVKRNSNVDVTNLNHSNGWDSERNLFGSPEERNLEQEILKELNHLSLRRQREIFDDLEKQQEKFNISRKSLVFSETENLSPLNLEELKSVRKTIKISNSTLPAIRNKRTLNFLLLAIARAMGYTLALTNPNAEWIPRQQPSSAQPCTTPPPPCPSNPSSTASPCAMPPTTPPCPGSGALVQAATIPPDQIDANTISYPYRPARTIPLFNFSPLPAGMRVLYPPLLRSPQQRSPCIIPQTPCSVTPPPSVPPCGTTPPPRTPSPCKSTSAPPPNPCGGSPPSSPAPCGTIPAPSPSPCKSNPVPPCSTTPRPSSPPCMPTPVPCSTTPSPSQTPCGTPQTPKSPPCATPASPSCGNSQPSPSPPPSESPKRGSIILEYDDPVRIQIFSNDKKYLPASGSVYSGHDDGHKEDWHSYFFPNIEKNKKKDEDFEEVEEEHIEKAENEEEEEEDEGKKAPKQLKSYEEEDERSLANKEEEEEDESETSLSIVKKPIDQDTQKTLRRHLVTKTQTSVLESKDKKNEKKDSKFEKSDKPQKTKKPKRKKWIRIVKKHKKSKTDLNPQNLYETYTSDTSPEASRVAPKYYGKGGSQPAFDSYEKDISDFFDDSSSHSSEDVSKIDLKKVIINNKKIKSPELLRGDRMYELNFNPYLLEPEEQRRKKLEKAVERYVEDYVEKQLGDELIKNTGIPKTTVFEFASKNGPKIQTITTTVAKTSSNKNLSNFKSQIKPETRARYKDLNGNGHTLKENSYRENFKKRGNFDYEPFDTRKHVL